ncbi:MAG: PIG-L family deacetylase [Nocardioides sp.]
MSVEFTHDGPGHAAADWAAHPLWESVPPFDLESQETRCTRMVVVAAHPDDETLGAGGLMARAHDLGLPVYVVLLTAGEGSHPTSTTLARRDLATRRLAEVEHALDLLAPSSPLVFLGVPDGQVAAAEAAVTGSLVDLVGDGRSTLVVAPWRRDGHPDHEAAGRAAAVAARRTGARLVEYPLWAWRHLPLDDLPWSMLRRDTLEGGRVERKQAAIRAHASQVAPLSEHPGDEVLLGPAVLEHFLGDREHFVIGTDRTDDALDLLHREQPDPWGVDERWYERRKRDLTLAALPRRRFRSGLEIGCSLGALAADLAPRCSSLLAVDRSERALTSARARLAGHPHVRVEAMDVPTHWPDGDLDLVVASEIGYFLSPAALDGLVTRVSDSLAPDGVVMLCHWRHPVAGWVLDGGDVHDHFADPRLPPVQARYSDRDVEIVVQCADDQWPNPRA